jgi:hypothetical protein
LDFYIISVEYSVDTLASRKTFSNTAPPLSLDKERERGMFGKVF